MNGIRSSVKGEDLRTNEVWVWLKEVEELSIDVEATVEVGVDGLVELDSVEEPGRVEDIDWGEAEDVGDREVDVGAVAEGVIVEDGVATLDMKGTG